MKVKAVNASGLNLAGKQSLSTESFNKLVADRKKTIEKSFSGKTSMA